MFVWSNVLTDTCQRERQAIRKCMKECVTIAANAWLYLMRTTITWIFSPCLRKHQFIVSVCIAYVFFLFNSCTCQLPVHCLVISGGVDDAIFSNTTFAHVLEQEKPSTINSVTQRHVKATCKRSVFAVFPLYGFYDMTFFFFLNQTLCAFSIALNLTLVFVIHFVEISVSSTGNTAICK